MFVYLLAGATSIAAYLVGSRMARLERSSLREAFTEFVECVGAFMFFLVLNLLLGMVVILLIRSTVTFVSIYLLTDIMLVLLSACQGIVFHLWWRRSRASKPRRARYEP